MIEQMMAAVILATIFGGIALVVAVFFWGVRMTRGLSGGHTREQLEEETRIIQEMYQGMNKMEERIEALETILFEQQRNEQRKKEKEGDNE